MIFCLCVMSDGIINLESEIMSYVRARLPSANNSLISGFLSEEEMVDELVNVTRPVLPGCFVGGAGMLYKCTHSTIFVHDVLYT